MTKFFLVGVVLAGFLGSGCSVDVSSFGAGTIAGLECARVRAGFVAPQPEGCWRSVVSSGCVVVVPGDQCADGLAWYPGGEPFEVWCDVDRELECDPVALVRVDCADVQ